MCTRRLLPWTLLASFMLHGVAYASLEAAPAQTERAPRRSQVRFDVVAKPKPPPPVPAQPEPAPLPSPPRPRRQAEPKAEPLAAPAPLTSEPETPAGVTLAGDGSGAGFAMPLGSGGALEPARTRAPAPLNVPAPIAPAPGPVRAEPALVAAGDLSSRPSPPALAAALEKNYPADARRRGLSGMAKVRARIDPDGVVRRVALLEESGPGFGTACSRTLNGSRWAAPKDKAGRAVATEIRYTCRFVIE